MMIRPPAILLESWSSHRSLKLRHWVSFAQHGTASLGRFTEQNDVVIPDHSVSGEHALIVHNNEEFWLHDEQDPESLPEFLQQRKVAVASLQRDAETSAAARRRARAQHDARQAAPAQPQRAAR